MLFFFKNRNFSSNLPISRWVAHLLVKHFAPILPFYRLTTSLAKLLLTSQILCLSACHIWNLLKLSSTGSAPPWRNAYYRLAFYALVFYPSPKLLHPVRNCSRDFGGQGSFDGYWHVTVLTPKASLILLFNASFFTPMQNNFRFILFCSIPSLP